MYFLFFVLNSQVGLQFIHFSTSIDRLVFLLNLYTWQLPRLSLFVLWRKRGHPAVLFLSVITSRIMLYYVSNHFPSMPSNRFRQTSFLSNNIQYFLVSVHFHPTMQLSSPYVYHNVYIILTRYRPLSGIHYRGVERCKYVCILHSSHDICTRICIYIYI